MFHLRYEEALKLSGRLWVLSFPFPPVNTSLNKGGESGLVSGLGGVNGTPTGFLSYNCIQLLNLQVPFGPLDGASQYNRLCHELGQVSFKGWPIHHGLLLCSLVPPFLSDPPIF